MSAMAPARTAHLDHLAVPPATPAMLDSARAWPLGVVANKARPVLRRDVQPRGWNTRFAAIVGAGERRADKPHPTPIWHARATIGVQSGPSVWYIGDTALDMQTAHAAGCTAVLLGDAAHNGGIALMQGSDCPPGLHFADAAALALQLKGLMRR